MPALYSGGSRTPLIKLSYLHGTQAHLSCTSIPPPTSLVHCECHMNSCCYLFHFKKSTDIAFFFLLQIVSICFWLNRCKVHGREGTTGQFPPGEATHSLITTVPSQGKATPMARLSPCSLTQDSSPSILIILQTHDPMGFIIPCVGSGEIKK